MHDQTPTVPIPNGFDSSPPGPESGKELRDGLRNRDSAKHQCFEDWPDVALGLGRVAREQKLKSLWEEPHHPRTWLPRTARRSPPYCGRLGRWILHRRTT